MKSYKCIYDSYVGFHIMIDPTGPPPMTFEEWSSIPVYGSEDNLAKRVRAKEDLALQVFRDEKGEIISSINKGPDAFEAESEDAN